MKFSTTHSNGSRLSNINLSTLLATVVNCIKKCPYCLYRFETGHVKRHCGHVINLFKSKKKPYNPLFYQ
ncbi:hypothetical protein DERP_010409 [Dermatophagoides pteronyssinus]|uniref:Uncharacterized protein n=1 Tax=Dermatophagoides pteronyssinus TaxID=6956 RepID=A0ABQ8J525_DERPT|nr:hypothetical protein DERP_010409 [Dermatophagoides pteronyssinus]